MLQLGEEDHVHDFCDWFVQKVRARPQKLEQRRAFWDMAGWKIAMGMRSGKTLGETTSEVCVDVDLFNECLTKEFPKDTTTKTGPTQKRAAQDDQGPPSQPQRPTSRGPPARDSTGPSQCQ